ncbi:MAG: hypothetical protein FJX46_09915 [Alphaproteobacteria bacterium]|nr:hypothetical protein [Alphaproteobacteria bacterium]
MAETSALGTVIARPGGERVGVRLRQRWPLAAIQIVRLGPGDDKAPADALGAALPAMGRSAVSGSGTLLWIGPGRWLTIMPVGAAARTLAVLAELNRTRWAVEELGSSRCAIRAGGPMAATLLAQGCAVDFHPQVFAIGAVAVTALHHMGVAIHRLDSDTWDIYVSRSFARDLWERLCHGAEQFGLAIEPTAP